MKIALCDDQTAHIELLRPYVEEFFRISEIEAEIFEFFSGEEMIESNEKFDIVFLDMELGSLTGVDVAKNINTVNPNAVIIVVTSYSEYLDEAMDLHVTRFLNKPVAQSKVYSALEKALEEINENLLSFTTKDNQVLRVKYRDIIYIESRFKSVTMYTAGGVYSSANYLKKFKAALTSSVFAIPHNSYIVNMNYISKFRREEIIVDVMGKEVNIPISSRKQSDFKRRFMAFIGEDE